MYGSDIGGLGGWRGFGRRCEFAEVAFDGLVVASSVFELAGHIPGSNMKI